MNKLFLLVTPTEEKLFSELIILKDNENRTNPFSLVTMELSPEAVALYDFMKGCEKLLIRINDMILADKDLIHHKNLLNFADEMEDKFFTARDIFVRNFPKEYSALVD